MAEPASSAGSRAAGQGTFLQPLQDMVTGVMAGPSEEDPTKEGSKEVPTKEGSKEVPPTVRLESSNFPVFEKAAGQAAEFLANAGLVVVLVVFMLIRREDLRNRLGARRAPAPGRWPRTTGA